MKNRCQFLVLERSVCLAVKPIKNDPVLALANIATHFLNLLSDRPMFDIDVHVLHLLAHSLHIFHGDVIGTLLEHSLYELLNPDLVLCVKPE